MDRYGIFVDAGYVIAAGGELCFSTNNRRMLSIDTAGLRNHLNSIAKKATGLSVLRMYWYDAAPYDGPTKDQREIADLANVKLRLGRIKSGRQKGVDALIYHDLVNLTRERAISDAFLISGDDDMLEAVKTVQEMGVRVTLVGIPPSKQIANQSRELRQEADEVIILKANDLSKFLHKREPPTESDEDHLSESDEDHLSTITQSVGSDFAKKLADDYNIQKIKSLHSRYPRIPRDIDATLIQSLSQALGILRVEDRLKRATRLSFWDTLNTLVPPTE